jgi:transposase
MQTFSFPAEDLRSIAHDRYHHPDPRVQQKMEVLWLKSHGLTQHRVAAYAGVSRRSVQRYLNDYRDGGLDRLRRCRWHQPHSALADHRASLEEHFGKHPPRSAKQA